MEVQPIRILCRSSGAASCHHCPPIADDPSLPSDYAGREDHGLYALKAYPGNEGARAVIFWV